MTKGDDIFSALLEPAEGATPSKTVDSADIAVSGDGVSVCISKLDSSTWVPLCAMVFEDKLVVCKKSKQSGAIHATLFILSEQANFHQHVIPKFHGPPIAECILSTTPQHKSPSPSPSSSSPLQYGPVLTLVLPSSTSESEHQCECIVEPELFLQLFGADCHIPTAAVVLVGGPNGHIFYCNLRNIPKNVTNDHFLKERKETPNIFKPLYSLDQPIVSIHPYHFPKRREQIDPSLFVDDLFSTSSAVPDSLLFLGQRGRIAICYAEGSTGSNKSQKFAQFIEYNVPGPILSSKLIPGQCLVYNSLRSLHCIDLREESFREAEESSPQLQLRCGPLLIPEPSFKFPERVSISIPLSVIVDCGLIGTNTDSGPDAMELEATNTGGLGMTLVSFRGNLCSLSTKFGGKEGVSHDPEMIAKDIKRCLNSMQVTKDEISATSGAISKVNADLIELNHVLRLLCVVKCHQEGTPCLIDNEEECPLDCAVSAGFKELGVSERELSIDITLLYRGEKSLGRGWSLLIVVSPSSHLRSLDHRNSTFSLDHGHTHLTTPTIVLSRCVLLEGLATNRSVEERIPISFTQRVVGPLNFFVSCYIRYDPSTIITAAALDKDDNLMSCGRSVSVLLNSRLLDALDFARLFMEVPRKLHQPLDLVTTAAYLDKSSSSTIDKNQAPLHAIRLPVPCKFLQTNTADDASALSSLLLPHIAGAEDKFRNGMEIRLTSYDSSGVSLQLVKEEGAREEDTILSHRLSLIVKSSSRSQLAEIMRCINCRFYQHNRNSAIPDPANISDTPSKEELFERYAEVREISQGAVAMLDQVTTLERLSREPSASEKAELISETFSLYSKLRQLPQL